MFTQPVVSRAHGCLWDNVMNTTTYKDLKQRYLNEDARALARRVFGQHQPSIHQTGFYSAPSWNWGYYIGLVVVNDVHYEVVTQFGEVEGARLAFMPEYKYPESEGK